MKVLVTGSSGLVGASLSESFRNARIQVVPFDLRYGGGDIRDAHAVRSAMQGCDGVVHLAAVSRVAWGEQNPELCDAVNVGGTANVVDAALGMARRPWLVFASSREVYGQLGTLPARETDPLCPVNVYGHSKLAGEQIVAGAQQAGLRAAILRLSNVYGTANDHPDRAVPSLLWRAMTGQNLNISGAETYFDFVHVEDCARGVLAVARQLEGGAQPPPLHLVTGIATSLERLARSALSVAGSTSGLTVLPARSFDVPGFVGDPALAAETIGWRAHIQLQEGLERLREQLSQRDRAMDTVLMPPTAELRTLRDIKGLEARPDAR